MGKSLSLTEARNNKYDEYYTLYSEIEKELSQYKEFFRDKIVYCNCDNCYESNFVKYFINNFNNLHIKKLISTCYDKDFIQDSLWETSEQKSNAIKFEVTRVIEPDNVFTDSKNTVSTLVGNGDYNSYECIEILRQCDVVVTNPPFSLFREYISTLFKYHKQFLIIGDPNAITGKEIFPLIMNNKMWLGNRPINAMLFSIIDDYQQYLIHNKENNSAYVVKDGVVYARVSAVWYTNITNNVRNTGIETYCSYSCDEYPMYDNFGAFNVDKSVTLPKDVDIQCKISSDLYPKMLDIYKKDITIINKQEEMLTVQIHNPIWGVPISFLGKYSPNQFSILGLSSRGYSPKYKIKTYTKNDSDDFNDMNGSCVIKICNSFRKVYSRMFIRRREIDCNERNQTIL